MNKIAINNIELQKAIGIYLLTNRIVLDDPKETYQTFRGFDLNELPVILGRAALYSVKTSHEHPTGLKTESFQGFYSAYPKDVFDIQRLFLIVRNSNPLELHIFSEKSKRTLPYLIRCGLVISEK